MRVGLLWKGQSICALMFVDDREYQSKKQRSLPSFLIHNLFDSVSITIATILGCQLKFNSYG